MALAHPTLSLPRIDYSPTFEMHMYGPMDLSFPSLDWWHFSVCQIIQIQYLCLFFSANQLPPVSQSKPTPWSTGLSVVATTRQLGHFQLSFYELLIGSFPTFKGPFTSLAKPYLKCLVSGLLTFQQCHFNLPMGPRSFWYIYPWK